LSIIYVFVSFYLAKILIYTIGKGNKKKNAIDLLKNYNFSKDFVKIGRIDNAWKKVRKAVMLMSLMSSPSKKNLGKGAYTDLLMVGTEKK
jgi:hypothetical protein